MRPGEIPKAKWLDRNTRSEIAASAGPLSLEKQHPQAASEGASSFFAIPGTIRQSGPKLSHSNHLLSRFHIARADR